VLGLIAAVWVLTFKGYCQILGRISGEFETKQFNPDTEGTQDEATRFS
jgi:hypothetical protein